MVFEIETFCNCGANLPPPFRNKGGQIGFLLHKCFLKCVLVVKSRLRTLELHSLAYDKPDFRQTYRKICDFFKACTLGGGRYHIYRYFGACLGCDIHSSAVVSCKQGRIIGMKTNRTFLEVLLKNRNFALKP